jgi:hypothetical protein
VDLILILSVLVLAGGCAVIIGDNNKIHQRDQIEVDPNVKQEISNEVTPPAPNKSVPADRLRK